MRNPTELMRSILTNETAKRIIDYVSPIYGNSYAGLWLFQAIGVALSDPCTISNSLLLETNPMTSTLLLDYWEAHYGLEKNPALTTEQRRNRIITKIRTRGACNPAKLAAAISSAMGGVEVDITENAAQNTFLVNIRENVSSFDEAVKVIERMKPAHLIYEVRYLPKSNPTVDIKTAVALTHGEMFQLQAVEQSANTETTVYVDGETLVAYGPGVQTDGETFLAHIASADGETLNFGGA